MQSGEHVDGATTARCILETVPLSAFSAYLLASDKSAFFPPTPSYFILFVFFYFNKNDTSPRANGRRVTNIPLFTTIFMLLRRERNIVQ
jgi:hypothetical protein